MIKSTLFSLYTFIKRPDDKRLDLTFNFKEKSAVLLILFTLNLVLHISIGFITDLFDEIEPEYKWKRDYSSLIVFIMIGLVMPFLEEFLFRYFLRHDKINAKIISADKWNALFPYLVYSSAFSFAIVHLINYTFPNFTWWYIYPITVIPHFMSGLILSFIRVRINFYAAVLFHMSWNSSLIILLAIFE